MNLTYNTEKPADFVKPDSVISLKIDYDKLVNEHIVMAVQDDFNGNVISGLFSLNNLPKMTTFEVEFNVKKSLFEDIIEFNGQTGSKYNLYIIEKGEKILVNSFVCNGDLVRIIQRKQNIFKNYEYYIEFEQD